MIGIQSQMDRNALDCSIINNRLYNWFEIDNGLCDEQGGI